MSLDTQYLYTLGFETHSHHDEFAKYLYNLGFYTLLTQLILPLSLNTFINRLNNKTNEAVYFLLIEVIT